LEDQAFVLLAEWGSCNYGTTECSCKETRVVPECTSWNRCSCLVQVDMYVHHVCTKARVSGIAISSSIFICYCHL